MKLKKLIPALIIIIVVFAGSLWILKVNFSDIPISTRVLIACGGGVLSGIVSYFLIGENNDEHDGMYKK